METASVDVAQNNRFTLVGEICTDVLNNGVATEVRRGPIIFHGTHEFELVHGCVKPVDRVRDYGLGHVAEMEDERIRTAACDQVIDPRTALNRRRLQVDTRKIDRVVAGASLDIDGCVATVRETIATVESSRSGDLAGTSVRTILEAYARLDRDRIVAGACVDGYRIYPAAVIRQQRDGNRVVAGAGRNVCTLYVQNLYGRRAAATEVNVSLDEILGNKRSLRCQIVPARF